MFTESNENLSSHPVETNVEAWWAVVRKIAQFLDSSGLGLDQEQIIRFELDREGCDPSDVRKAFEWLESVMQSGSLKDALNIFMDAPGLFRALHPLEIASIHPRIIKSIFLGYSRGFISQIAAERMIEGARLVDTRDWVKEDIDNFIQDLFGPMASGVLEPQNKSIIYN